MAHVGMFCLPWTGHLNPFAAVADELVRRGHEVTFFNIPELGELVRSRGFDFEAYGTVASLMERSRGFSRPRGAAGFDGVYSQTELLFATAPAIVEDAQLDLWIVDHMDYAASTLAACMRQPFVSLVVTLPRHYEDGVPGFSGEIDLSDPAARERDRIANDALLEAGRPYRDFLSAYRAQADLGPFSYNTAWSDLAQIAQMPRELELPRTHLPPCFHFTAPFIRRDRRPPVDFTPRRRPGRPLIYTSFGTVQNIHLRLYESVARAAAAIDADFILSTGGESLDILPADLPANVSAASSVPQLDVLEQADLMITHAGMNSTLECLAAGVPMVAVPIADDQPAISARIVRSGTGVRIRAQECEADQLRAAIATVLDDPSYREAALRFKRLLAARDGPSEAGSIIERVLETGRPVLRPDAV